MSTEDSDEVWSKIFVFFMSSYDSIERILVFDGEKEVLFLEKQEWIPRDQRVDTFLILFLLLHLVINLFYIHLQEVRITYRQQRM